MPPWLLVRSVVHRYSIAPQCGASLSVGQSFEGFTQPLTYGPRIQLRRPESLASRLFIGLAQRQFGFDRFRLAAAGRRLRPHHRHPRPVTTLALAQSLNERRKCRELSL